ncbi:nitrate reductase cytochrome c-type subunit [Mesosutterella sp. AGMB02718]|uniref:Nitrate reductase cytochrome c-type subunit n=1 Tax=Mesosutterella faecium TaxID=2925194 RepID=A0ABT7IM42_9BURK|nr:nitrate reductase cytochrome c-type subunit [Mesosutterella sp. AGMB02718]MDL2059427.1 nitrate reductase cytochrome c-type subunit [Mesosutterella sp. AGMB02718]
MMTKKIGAAAFVLLAAFAVNAGAATNVLIPHDTKGMEITKDKNMCLMCHADSYKRVGQPAKKGTATAMPADHWMKGKNGAMEPAPIRYNCSVCHSPANNY